VLDAVSGVADGASIFAPVGSANCAKKGLIPFLIFYLVLLWIYLVLECQNELSLNAFREHVDHPSAEALDEFLVG
jgi:hypothetical protein